MSSDVERELECVICRNVMADPRMLDCQHSFCLRCIYGCVDKVRGEGEVSVKCPYNCSVTETHDVRALGKSTIITNLCHDVREKMFKTPGGDKLCDACGEDSGDRCVQCPKCSSLLCPECERNDATHRYLCGSMQKFYPFYYGWSLSEAALRCKLSHHARGVKFTNIQRVFLPAMAFRCKSTVRVRHVSTEVVETTRTLLEGPEIPQSFRDQVESDPHTPDSLPQLDLLFKIQEIRTRQVALLAAVRNLLTSPHLAPTLARNSATIADLSSWDCGLANDCAVLIEMQLILVKQLCSPLVRKILVLATLEGLKQLQGGSARARQTVARQLKLVTKIELSLSQQAKVEAGLFGEIETNVRGLMAKQYDAYTAWGGKLSVVTLRPADARLRGGVDLQTTHNGDRHILGRFSSGGQAAYDVQLQSTGTYVIGITYASPEPSGIAINGGHIELPPTGSWGSHSTSANAGEIHLCKGSAIITIAASATGHPSPDIAEVTLQLKPEVSSQPQAATGTHDELLTILGFCHKLQLEILEALEITYEGACTSYWGGEKEEFTHRETTISKERSDLLNMLRNVQQVRIFHRQYFYCVLSGLTLPKLGGTVHPFPVTVPRPSKRATAESLPNLLQALQPRIQELREEQQNSISRNPPVHIQEQFQSVLLQTLELLHREQVLQLREGVQEAREQLMLYIQPGSVSALLEHLTPLPEGTDAYRSKNDVHDLQTIQTLWDKVEGKGVGTDVQLADRLTRGIVEGLVDYTSAVIRQRQKLEKCILELSEEVAGVEALVEKRDAVGVAADKLETHLKVVEKLRGVIKMAQSTGSSTKRFRLLSKVIIALRKLKSSGADAITSMQDYLSSDTVTGGEGLVLSPGEEPLLAWFVGQKAMEGMGLLEQCFSPAPRYWEVDKKEVEIDAETRMASRDKIVATHRRSWVVQEFLSCLSLQPLPDFTDPIELSTQHTLTPPHLAQVLHLPYYKGEYTTPSTPTPLPFLINAQTGTVHLTPPPHTMSTFILTTFDLVRHPLPWLALNGVAMWCRGVTWWAKQS